MKLPKKLIAVALLVVALVLINSLAAMLPVRIDATADKIYTFSPGTLAILKKIKEPVTLNFYWSKSASSPEVAYKNFAERVGEMLHQYVRYAHGKIILNVIDPKPDTPEEENATNAGVRAQKWPNSGEKVYLGLVAVHVDQQKALPAFDPNRESFLEYDISQLIYSVQLSEKKKLGLISSIPLMGVQQSPWMQIQQQPRFPQQFVIQEWRKTFDITPVNQTATELPADLDALAVVHPEDLSPKLQFAIDQFLLSGKPVFLAVDPTSTYFRRQSQGADSTPVNISSDFAPLKAYGITYDPHNIVADVEKAAEVQNPNTGTVARFPDWLALDKESLNPKSLPTAQLESVLFVDAGSFTVAPNPAYTVTPLLQSSAQSDTMPAGVLDMVTQPDRLISHINPTGQKLLAAIITGKFKTAFPSGAPTAAVAKDDSAKETSDKNASSKDKPEEKKDAVTKTETKPSDKPAPSASPAIKESPGSSILIFVADTDWLLDDFSVRRFMTDMGTPAYAVLNNNAAFAANSLDFLSGSQDLISIRGKGSSLRPFTVVTQMETEAQKKYQQQLDSLERRMREIDQQLDTLQNRTGDSGDKNLVASPEMQKNIDEYRKQEAEVQRQTRIIRLALREGIDALGNHLLIANLLFMPVAVTAFGLWFFRRRRR